MTAILTVRYNRKLQENVRDLLHRLNPDAEQKKKKKSRYEPTSHMNRDG